MNDQNDQPEGEVSNERRALLKAIAQASGLVASRVLLPALWATPVITGIALPAHAATSCSDEHPAAIKDHEEKAGGVIVLTVAIPTPDPGLKSGQLQFAVFDGDTQISAYALANGSTTMKIEVKLAPGTHALKVRFDCASNRSGMSAPYNVTVSQ